MNTRTSIIAALVGTTSCVASAGYFPGPGGVIADNGTTTYELNIQHHSPVIRGVTVTLDINHTWVGDLTITLEHAGVSVTLLDRLGVPETTVGNGADLNGVYTFDSRISPSTWDPYETPGASAGVTVIPGEYGLNNTDGTSLADFKGLDVFGAWTLTISDGVGLDIGALNAWHVDTGFFPSPGAAALFGFGAIASARRRR